MTFKITHSIAGRAYGLAETINNAQAHKGPTFFLDANIWDVTVDPELWRALISRGSDVFVIPQIKSELGNWLRSHPDHIATQALLSSPSQFTLMSLPLSGTADWDTYAYYVALLAIRRHIGFVARAMFQEARGREPSKSELIGQIQKIGGERALGLAYKHGGLCETPDD